MSLFVPEVLVDRVIAAFDSARVIAGAPPKRDGKVSTDELDLDVAAYRLGQTLGAAPYLTRYDASGDGLLDRDELVKMLHAIGPANIAAITARLGRVEQAKRDFEAARSVFGDWELSDGRRLQVPELEDLEDMLHKARLDFAEKLVSCAPT